MTFKTHVLSCSALMPASQIRTFKPQPDTFSHVQSMIGSCQADNHISVPSITAFFIWLLTWRITSSKLKRRFDCAAASRAIEELRLPSSVQRYPSPSWIEWSVGLWTILEENNFLLLWSIKYMVVEAFWNDYKRMLQVYNIFGLGNYMLYDLIQYYIV